MEEGVLVQGELLDTLLARGYYRMQQNMFTTYIYSTEDFSLDVFWLRTKLPALPYIQKHPVYKRNKGFDIQLSDAFVSEEIEELYVLYKSGIDFDPADSVSHYLYSGEQKIFFNSKCIQIRDEGKLIGLGYFDVGEKAITGIMNFYHPNYKKYSIGKYLMLRKMQYAIEHQMHYYYTGYLALGTTKFDYKLFPDSSLVEVFIPNLSCWFPFDQIGKDGLSFFSIMPSLDDEG